VNAPEPSAEAMLATAARVFRLESESIAALTGRLSDNFPTAVQKLLDTRGRIVVTGVGKSGLVARKIASTLSSTGTPALFLHPVEGVHGDVGVLLRDDLLVVVSHSGESDELSALLPVVRRLGIEVIAITGRVDSTLGKAAVISLDVGVEEEACPHDLTPTSSSSAAMAMGDALAIAALEARGFDEEDFARLHPAGALGRRLLLRVADVMVDDPEQLPGVEASTPLSEAMGQVAHRRGTVPVLDEDRRVVGLITAGDLTRFAARHDDFLARPAAEAMNRSPKCIAVDARAAEALEVMERQGIMAMPVLGSDGVLCGIVHLHDLLKARVR